MNSRLPNSFGRSNGTTVVLLHVPCRSGAPRAVWGPAVLGPKVLGPAVLGVDCAAALFEVVCPINAVWVDSTARTLAAASAARNRYERGLILICDPPTRNE